jgi:hypothetical protein
MKTHWKKRKPEKIQGKGTLEGISSDGPHREWLGMPAYYIHTLTIDAQEYAFISTEPALEVSIGDTVTFRYSQTGNTRRIDKRSLGISIDPTTYKAKNTPGQ